MAGRRLKPPWRRLGVTLECLGRAVGECWSVLEAVLKVLDRLVITLKQTPSPNSHDFSCFGFNLFLPLKVACQLPFTGKCVHAAPKSEVPHYFEHPSR